MKDTEPAFETYPTRAAVKASLDKFDTLECKLAPPSPRGIVQ